MSEIEDVKVLLERQRELDAEKGAQVEALLAERKHWVDVRDPAITKALDLLGWVAPPVKPRVKRRDAGVKRGPKVGSSPTLNKALDTLLTVGTQRTPEPKTTDAPLFTSTLPVTDHRGNRIDKGLPR